MFELIGYSKSYREKVFAETTIEIGAKNISFLMGPNGCGKTTLIKCIAGLEGYNGDIKYNGKDVSEIRKKMLVIWDDCPFYNELSGINNLLVLAENPKIKKADIFDVARRYFNKEVLLRKVKTYSYGQRKKLALVLQRLLKPEVLIMDEISNGLDYDTIKFLQGEIKAVSNQSKIILTGHQFSFYEGLVEEILVIKDNTIKNVTEEYNSCNQLSTIYERYYGDEQLV